ncbi:MAG: DUF1189 family protein [Clostridia bacterium]|nr:DUF1189 family protein [Clostridia bacterium]
MKKFLRSLLKFPKVFIKTLTDFKYYSVLDKLPSGRAVMYLLLLSFLLSIVAVLPAAFAIDRSVKEFYRVYEESAPDFTIAGGRMTTGTGGPVRMIDEPGKALAVIFDETDSIAEYDLREYESALLMDSDSVLIKTPFSKQDIPYAAIFPEGTDKDDFSKYLGLVTLSNIIFIALFIILFILFNMIGAFFISSVGNIFLSFKRVRIGFARSYALACYASTLPVVLKTLRLLFALEIRYFDIIYVLIGLLYFWNGANHSFKAIIEESRRTPDPGDFD